MLYKKKSSTHFPQLQHSGIFHNKRLNISLTGQDGGCSGHQGGRGYHVYGYCGGRGGSDRNGRGGCGGQSKFENGIGISELCMFYTDGESEKPPK